MSERINVPDHLMSHGRAAEHYVLRIVGDSMDDEGIHDGDYVIVLRRHEADSGEMIVALVGDLQTIKRVFFEAAGMVRLEAANASRRSVTIPARDLTIQGIVVGLMRKF